MCTFGLANDEGKQLVDNRIAGRERRDIYLYIFIYVNIFIYIYYTFSLANNEGKQLVHNRVTGGERRDRGAWLPVDPQPHLHGPSLDPLNNARAKRVAPADPITYI